MQRIAYLVSENYQDMLSRCAGFFNELEYLQPFFSELNAELVPVNWRAHGNNWDSYSLLLPKAVWDYFDHPAEFEQFVRERDAAGSRFVNSAKTILWNMRKTYLSDLAKKGLCVGEHHIVPQGARTSTESLKQWAHVYAKSDSIILKPSVSGASKNTARCSPSELHQHKALIESILAESDLIIQPFFEEIPKSGEFSYFFFGGTFSHAIQKLPAQGDFRAHSLFGGRNYSLSPDAAEIKLAREFFERSGYTCQYARVDVFKRDGKLFLVELELLEPHLYFENAGPDAGRLFAKAVLSSAP